MTCCWSHGTKHDSCTSRVNFRRTITFTRTCSSATWLNPILPINYSSKVAGIGPTPDLLINNAGFGLYGAFSSHPLPRIQEMLHIHVQTVVESIRLFLPGMIERGSGAIINVSSIAGLLPIPYFAEYAATKAFLLSFSEALAEEVQSTGVYVQACCPGSTDTDFHETAKFRPSSPMGRQSVTQVVKASLAALQTRQPVVTVGWQGKLAVLLAKWVPRKTLVKTIGKRFRPPTQ